MTNRFCWSLAFTSVLLLPSVANAVDRVKDVARWNDCTWLSKSSAEPLKIGPPG